jgi:hypothetical protein
LVRVGQFGDFYLDAKLYLLENDLDLRIAGGLPIGVQGVRQCVQPGSRDAAIQKIQAQFRETVEEIGSVAGGSAAALVFVRFYLLRAQYRGERCGGCELRRLLGGGRQLRPQVLREIRCIRRPGRWLAPAGFRVSGTVDHWRLHFASNLDEAALTRALPGACHHGSKFSLSGSFPGPSAQHPRLPIGKTCRVA